jgi:hypothetical protein
MTNNKIEGALIVLLISIVVFVVTSILLPDILLLFN